MYLDRTVGKTSRLCDLGICRPGSRNICQLRCQTFPSRTSCTSCFQFRPTCFHPCRTLRKLFDSNLWRLYSLGIPRNLPLPRNWTRVPVDMQCKPPNLSLSRNAQADTRRGPSLCLCTCTLSHIRPWRYSSLCKNHEARQYRLCRLCCRQCFLPCRTLRMLFGSNLWRRYSLGIPRTLPLQRNWTRAPVDMRCTPPSLSILRNSPADMSCNCFVLRPFATNHLGILHILLRLPPRNDQLGKRSLLLLPQHLCLTRGPSEWLYMCH